jgi:hypothetical protein
LGNACLEACTGGTGAWNQYQELCASAARCLDKYEECYQVAYTCYTDLSATQKAEWLDVCECWHDGWECLPQEADDPCYLPATGLITSVDCEDWLAIAWTLYERRRDAIERWWDTHPEVDVTWSSRGSSNTLTITIVDNTPGGKDYVEELCGNWADHINDEIKNLCQDRGVCVNIRARCAIVQQKKRAGTFDATVSMEDSPAPALFTGFALILAAFLAFLA